MCKINVKSFYLTLQALKAGENALSQMRLVLDFSYGQRNPAVIAKCWLFVAMSLMQQVQDVFRFKLMVTL